MIDVKAESVADKFKVEYKIGLDNKIVRMNDICDFHDLHQKTPAIVLYKKRGYPTIE